MPSPPPPTSPISPIERAADTFAAELARWRVERGLTKKQLANQMGFDPSYVSHVEGRRHRPTEDFARRAEAVLGAGGAIWLRYQNYDDLRHARAGPLPQRDPPAPEQWMPPGTGLIVEQEIATLTYLGGAYRCVVRRALYNAGTEPVTRYLVRVAVDRFPDDPERSNKHHRDNPLTFDELDLHAYCDDPPAREEMVWRKKHDRDAFKEVWLLFENAHGRFPLYPGERITIEYSYTVDEDKWGRWFERAVRIPTRRLAVRLDFPAEVNAQVWGVEASLSKEEAPLRTPIVRRIEGDRTRFEWSTESPTLNARYRLEWHFRTPSIAPVSPAAGAYAIPGSYAGREPSAVPVSPAPLAPLAPAVSPVSPAVGPVSPAVGPVSPAVPPFSRSGPGIPHVPQPRAGGNAPSDRMRAVGIVQRGSALLAHPAVPLRLPADADAARDIVERLLATLGRVTDLHPFTKGVGLAAPQIGVAVAVAVVRPPDPTATPLVLLNPRVVDASPQSDVQYEGCLSFFDVRGLVPRPLRLDVEHARWDGVRRVTTFERGMARLVAHEIDHLEGRLYDDRMAPDAPLVPVTEYRTL